MEGQGLAPRKDRLEQLVQFCLDEARQLGAESAEASIDIEHGLSVTARLGEVETLENHNTRGLGVTVYVDHRKGTASTTDFDLAAVRDAVTSARNIAKFTEQDECAGLADPDQIVTEVADLGLDRPWPLNPDEAVEIAIECEDKAREPEQVSNSEGASVDTWRSTHIYGNSHGFIGRYVSTRHSLSCAVIAEQDGGMQRDYWYTTSRDPAGLQSATEVGKKAAQRTVSRLGARKIATQTTPVIFEAGMARSLLSHFVSAISGSALYRKASFLLDHLNKKVFSDLVTLVEDPHIRGGLASSAFDLEGVATRPRTLVADGVLQGYVLNSYSARKLGMQTTGNAGGIHNLTLKPGEQTLDDLMSGMQRGFLVTELIGHGVNGVTGDYSRGAMGYWIENGEIQHPVEEVTVAGNLKEIFQRIVAIGNDTDARGRIITPSVLIDEMTVAGS
ncbi:MAG: metalloprotease PmbA [Gammaproteobacteria bacterium]|nr:metalloprotease PmbA [Gammaproteobacteria bacterium]